jgi:hypothetical protein
VKPATNLVFDLPAEPADIEDQPLALAAELRRLADELHAAADRLDGGYMTIQEAAEAIGRSPENVRQWARRFGIGHFDDASHCYVISRSKLVAHVLATQGRLPHGLAGK